MALAPASINWIPAHPSYGGISMYKYWNLLANECLPQDPYQCSSIIPLPEEHPYQISNKAIRAWSRIISYPLQIRFAEKSPITHILDHSWAELLDCLPSTTRSVITVHDLIPLRDPGGLTPAEVKRFHARVSRLKRADAVIAVSEYTRLESIELLGIHPNRIHVVPNGVQVPLDFPYPTLLSSQHLRIGSVGSTLSRKNLAILPSALRAYKAANTHQPLLIRAGQELDNTLRSELHVVLGTEGFQELGCVSNAQLEDFYACLDVLVLPSHYEGFGLPVLEAMARGVPVIAARTSSLPEVGGDAALYFDPNDPEELAQRLREVADPNIAASLREAGLLRAKGFSWRSTLEGFFSIYDTLIK